MSCVNLICCHKGKTSKHADDLDNEPAVPSSQKVGPSNQTMVDGASPFDVKVVDTCSEVLVSQTDYTHSQPTTQSSFTQSAVPTSSVSQTDYTQSSLPTHSSSTESAIPTPQVASSIQSEGHITVIKIAGPPAKPIFKPPDSKATNTQPTLPSAQEQLEIAMATEVLSGLIERLESVTSRLEKLDSGSGAGEQQEGIPPYVKAFDDIVKGPVAECISLGKELGDSDLTKQLTAFSEAFKCQRAFLDVASRSKKPAQNILAKLIEPTGNCLKEVVDIKEQNRRSPVFNHLSAIAECAPALGWVAVEPTPGPFVKDMAEAAQFYVNRVLKEFKQTSEQHVKFIRSLPTIWVKLAEYIKNYHTTGVSWNLKGGDATTAAASARTSGPPPPPAGGAPPPPPPPAVLPPTPAGGQPAGEESNKRAELFAALNRGGDVTKGLKKVSDDMKTHKNPALRSGPAPYKPPTSAKPVAAVKPKQEVHKEPVLELRGKKWVVEHQQGNRNIVIDQTETKQIVYIYKCVDSTIVVKNKVNGVVLDGCKKCAVVCDNLIAAMEFVNCQSVQCQILGKVPTISIDKTDGCQVYLSKESISAHIVTSKSSEMNILIPQADGDFSEFAIPEQFKTVWDGKSLVTTMADV